MFFHVFILICKCLMLIAGLAVIGKLFIIVRNYRKLSKYVNAIPGPSSLPILGDTWSMWVPAEEIIKNLHELLKKFRHEPLTRLWIGPEPKIFIQSGNAAEDILKSSEHVNKSYEYQATGYWLGTGLLSSDREKWEKRRKLLNPSFSTAIIDGFMPIFNEQSQILVDLLKKHCGKGAFNIVPYFSNCALDNICECIMGVKVDSQHGNSKDYVAAVHGMATIYMLRTFRPWLKYDFLFNLTQLRKDEIRYVKTLHAFSKKVITDRKQQLDLEKNGSNTKTGDEVFGQKRRLASLDLLLEGSCDGEKLDFEGIREEVDILCVAGHDTTASSITFTCYMLGLYLEIQKKVQEEIDAVFGESDLPMTTNDLLKLKYLDAVIREAMRLYPPTPILGRRLTEEMIINGYTIPADVTVVLATMWIHHDPVVFPEPEKFDPDRFFGENALGRSQYAYIPFGAGPRNCIGQKFGWLELKAVVTHVARNFTIVSHDRPEDLKLVAGPILQSVNGIHVSLRSRR